VQRHVAPRARCRLAFATGNVRLHNGAGNDGPASLAT
jgi:hypothetical protein